MGFDILQASKNITEKYIRYLKTVFDIDDPTYKKLFNQEINNIGSFSKGPYLDVVDSFESGMKVQDLIDDGILSKDFKYIPDIYSKTLYKHQEISVKKLSEGKNVVVSTGTGSGKTESFLVPIINSLMKEKEEKGAKFFITQIFYDNDYYYRLVFEARKIGIKAPIIPGIMPLTNPKHIKRIKQMCGSTIPLGFRNMIEIYKEMKYRDYVEKSNLIIIQNTKTINEIFKLIVNK